MVPSAASDRLEMKLPEPPFGRLFDRALEQAVRAALDQGDDVVIERRPAAPVERRLQLGVPAELDPIRVVDAGVAVRRVGVQHVGWRTGRRRR